MLKKNDEFVKSLPISGQTFFDITFRCIEKLSASTFTSCKRITCQTHSWCVMVTKQSYRETTNSQFETCLHFVYAGRWAGFPGSEYQHSIAVFTKLNRGHFQRGPNRTNSPELELELFHRNVNSS